MSNQDVNVAAVILAYALVTNWAPMMAMLELFKKEQ